MPAGYRGSRWKSSSRSWTGGTGLSLSSNAVPPGGIQIVSSTCGGPATPPRATPCRPDDAAFPLPLRVSDHPVSRLRRGLTALSLPPRRLAPPDPQASPWTTSTARNEGTPFEGTQIAVFSDLHNERGPKRGGWKGRSETPQVNGNHPGLPPEIALMIALSEFRRGYRV